MENAISGSSGFEHTHKVPSNLITARSITLERGKSKGTKELYFRKVAGSHIGVPCFIKQFVNMKFDYCGN